MHKSRIEIELDDHYLFLVVWSCVFSHRSELLLIRRGLFGQTLGLILTGEARNKQTLPNSHQVR